MYVIITGNPIDGIKLLGLFDSIEMASDYAEDKDLGADWWIARIEPAMKGE